MRYRFGLPACCGTLVLSLLLTACGGGDSTTANTPAASPVSSTAPAELNAPVATGNTATDGFNQFNFRRRQMGLASLSRNARIDDAALGHSTYQKVNDAIGHEQTVGRPGFTGVDLLARLTASGYKFTSTNGYAYGEVIAASGDVAGAGNAEDLIAAIYHRFVIFEPKFTEAGAGSAGLSATGYNFLTVDFSANGLNGGIGKGQIALYPFANQTSVATVFYSDQESPDPVPNQNAVGYPVSVHADIDAVVTVASFTISPRGGRALATRLLSAANNSDTPASSAAIVPLTVLTASTTYDVQFTGTVAGMAVTRNWSFTTR